MSKSTVVMIAIAIVLALGYAVCDTMCWPFYPPYGFAVVKQENGLGQIRWAVTRRSGQYRQNLQTYSTEDSAMVVLSQLIEAERQRQLQEFH